MSLWQKMKAGVRSAFKNATEDPIEVVFARQLESLPNRSPEQESLLEFLRLANREPYYWCPPSSGALCDGWNLSPAELKTTLETMRTQVKPKLAPNSLWEHFWSSSAFPLFHSNVMHGTGVQSHDIEAGLASETQTIPMALSAVDSVRDWLPTFPGRIRSIEKLLADTRLSGLGFTAFEVRLGLDPLGRTANAQSLLADLRTARSRLYAMNDVLRLFKEFTDASYDEASAQSLREFVDGRVTRLCSAVSRGEGFT